MHHYIFRTTTDKLEEHAQHIAESGDRIVDAPVFVGGRDWVLLCRKGEPSVAELNQEQLVAAIAKGVRDGIAAGRRDEARELRRLRGA